MSASTTLSDGSDEVLIHAIDEVRAELGRYRDGMTERVVDIDGRVEQIEGALSAMALGAELPTTELSAFEVGRARVAIVVQRGPVEHDFVAQINNALALVESEGATVESIRPVAGTGGYAAFIVYRLPTPATEESR